MTPDTATTFDGNERIAHQFREIVVTDGLIDNANSAERGDVFTHGATPLDRVHNAFQQYIARFKLLKLSTEDITPGIPSEITQKIPAIFERRFDARAIANEENFLTALMYDDMDSFDPRIIEMIDRGRTGHASPAELLLIRSVMGIRSIELGCLTHPYGKNIKEYLDGMREAVETGVDILGGEMFDEPDVQYSAKEWILDKDNVNKGVGILMTRKRTIGMLPDGTMIRERSSFILRTDSRSGFDPELLAKLRKIPDDDDDAWKEAMMQLGNLAETAHDLLESDAFDIAIPISTTAYAFNPETAFDVMKKSETKKKIDQRRRDEKLRHDSPFLHAFLNGLPVDMNLTDEYVEKMSIVKEQYPDEHVYRVGYYEGKVTVRDRINELRRKMSRSLKNLV